MRKLSILVALVMALAGCTGGSGGTGTTTSETTGNTTGSASANPVDGFVVFLPPTLTDAGALRGEEINAGGGATAHLYRAEFSNPSFEGLPGSITISVRPRPEGMPDAVLAAVNAQAFEDLDSAACGNGQIFAYDADAIAEINRSSDAEVISILFKGCDSAGSEDFSVVEVSSVIRSQDKVVLSSVSLVRPKYDLEAPETWLTKDGGVEVNPQTIHAGIEIWPRWIGAITPCLADPASGPAALAPCLDGSGSPHVPVMRELGYDAAFIG